MYTYISKHNRLFRDFLDEKVDILYVSKILEKIMLSFVKTQKIIQSIMLIIDFLEKYLQNL